MDNGIFRDYVKYVSLNILGMIGLSCYILVDTFFVAKALQAVGIAALNFSIPIYSVIHGIGLMIAIGGSTRYSILKSQNQEEKANNIFTHCIILGIVIGALFVLAGLFGSTQIATLMGAEGTTLPLTKVYLTTILCFAPCYILNNIILAYVRNDNNPKLSMIGMLAGSFSNIVLDYIFMFILNMGMFGAAFATGLAPIISLGILSIHFIRRKNNFRMVRIKLIRATIRDIFSLGLSAFINEISTAVVLITFNLVILKMEGYLGVAAYGIVANLSLVGISVFTGIAQGIQPLVSKGYGENNQLLLKKVLKYAMITSLVIATVIYLLTSLYSVGLIQIFNSDQNQVIAKLSMTGLRIYFIGFFFAGINIVITMYDSAVEQANQAFVLSILRGCLIIVPMVFVLSSVWRMTGIWLSFVVTEAIVCVIALSKVR